MHRSSARWFCSFLVAFTSGCGATRPEPRGVPEMPRPVAVPVPVSSPGPWAFAPAAGTRAYRIWRTASIEGVADSVPRREVVSNFTRQILTLERIGAELGFKAVIDTFTPATQGVIGPAQAVELPIQLIGKADAGGVHIESPPSGSCDATRAIAATDLYNLLAPFPPELAKGAVWRDSVIVSGCQAGIPTTATTTRTFTVSGEVNHAGRSLLLVRRADSVNARGEGAYGQHRMTVEGAGSGSAFYYLDTTSGEVFQLTTNQRSRITVTTSGRRHSFTQTTSQDFVRGR